MCEMPKTASVSFEYLGSMGTWKDKRVKVTLAQGDCLLSIDFNGQINGN